MTAQGWYAALRSNGYGPGSAAMSLGQHRRHGRWSELTWAEVELGRLLDCAGHVGAALTSRETAELVRATSSEPEQWDLAVSESLARQTRRVLATLTPREEKVIRMRFGIGEPTDYTLEEVAADFGVSRERIRQIEAKALRKLREPKRLRCLAEFVDDDASDRRRRIESVVASVVRDAPSTGTVASAAAPVRRTAPGPVLIAGLRFCATGRFSPTGYALIRSYEFGLKEAA